MKHLLFNVAHPMAESGQPIFIPFGEWKYDASTRQRLDRAHGERIANELNARVAKGDPGIPVYQGHPDVPQLAAKYPDKGALGWVTRIELVNESPDGRAVPGLALTVEWDRDPGRGFRWFSPYWLANSREGGTYIVDEIASIGLVNNPNIPEFRLANEEQPMKKKLNPAIIELAAKYDRLANEANFDESKHPRDADGKFSSGGGEHVETIERKRLKEFESQLSPAQLKEYETGRSRYLSSDKRFEEWERLKDEAIRSEMRPATEKESNDAYRFAFNRMMRRMRRHRIAITSGKRYNPTTHQYE